MLLRAVTFTLNDRATGACLGHAAIVPDAHYISIDWSGADHMERRLADPDGWQLLGTALRDPLAKDPLDATNVIVRMLLPTHRRVDVAVQYVDDRLVEVPRLHDTASHLDGVLRRIAV
jgi:hypothetical protein